jgi:hypothetical protein
MQENLRLMLWTAVAVAAVWFVVMTVSVHMFLHPDADDVVCGTLVDYKLNLENQIVFLCPQGLSPLRKQVVARSISDEFRKNLPRVQLIKVNQIYPVAAANATATPAPVDTVAAPAQAPSTNAPSTVPAEVIPVQPPAAAAAPVAPAQTVAPATAPTQNIVPASKLPPPVPQ